MSALDSIDSIYALIIKCRSLQEVTRELLPALKKLDKSAPKATSAATAAAATTASSPPAASAASTSETASTSAPAPTEPADAASAAPPSQATQTVASTTSGSILETLLVNGADPLEQLDPAVSSVGYLFILNARCSAPSADLNALRSIILNFSLVYDPIQLRIAPEQVNFFARQLHQIADAKRDPAFAIEPLKNLVTRFAPAGTLTSLHPIFLQVVLYSRLYDSARALLLNAIDDIDTSVYPLKYQDHLAYHYLGGTILALLGEYVLAADMLEICISAPGPGISSIQLDAYKKHILVQLLAFGKTKPLPQYAAVNVINACKAASGVYGDYAAAYAAQDKAKVWAFESEQREAFEKDCNYGLLIQCQRAFRRRLIQNLTETFITVSLLDIATAIELPPTEDGLRDTESEILSMLASGEVHGSLSHPPGSVRDLASVTVTFTDDPEPYNSHATVARVTAAIHRAAQLEKQLQTNELAMLRSKEFVNRAFNQASNNHQPGGLGSLDDLDVTMSGGGDWAEGSEEDD